MDLGTWPPQFPQSCLAGGRQLLRCSTDFANDNFSKGGGKKHEAVPLQLYQFEIRKYFKLIYIPSFLDHPNLSHFVCQNCDLGEYFGLWWHTKHAVGTASPFPSHWQLWVGNCETGSVAFNMHMTPVTYKKCVSWLPRIFSTQILACSGSKSEDFVKYSSNLPSRVSDIYGFQYGLFWLPIESFGEGFVNLPFLTPHISVTPIF